MQKTTVTDLQQQKKLVFRRGDYNILDCGIRTGKTYWAVNNLAQFTRDGNLHRILFLVDTSALKQQLLTQYGDSCIEADDLWEAGNKVWADEDLNKIGVMCYQKLGMKFLKQDTEFLKQIDVICWDQCDSIFDFATQAFVKARRTDFARKNASNAQVLSVIQTHSTKKEYMPLILLGAWQHIIQLGQIMCIGLSASPQRAYAYYKSLVSASYQGKLEMGYRAATDIYFCNIVDHINQLTPELNRGYWCYSPLIQPNQDLVRAAAARGFRAIELHSLQNQDKPMNEQQRRVYNIIVTTGLVPLQYDFVIVNRALARGITIVDKRFDHVIIDSVNQVDRIQAARQTFQYQRHLKVLAPQIPAQYMNTWLTLEKCRQLAAYMNVPEISKDNHNINRVMTWNRLKEYLPVIGYKIQSKRKRVNGKQIQCYYITGEWHDVEIAGDNDFMQLVAARQEQELE